MPEAGMISLPRNKKRARAWLVGGTGAYDTAQNLVEIWLPRQNLISFTWVINNNFLLVVFVC
jgi:hypothetical protein